MFELYVYHYRVFTTTSNVKTYCRKYIFKTARGLCRCLKRLSWRKDPHDAIVYVPVPNKAHRIQVRIRFDHNMFEPTFLQLIDTLKTLDFIKREVA